MLGGTVGRVGAFGGSSVDGNLVLPDLATSLEVSWQSGEVTGTSAEAQLFCIAACCDLAEASIIALSLDTNRLPGGAAGLPMGVQLLGLPGFAICLALLTDLPIGLALLTDLPIGTCCACGTFAVKGIG